MAPLAGAGVVVVPRAQREQAAMAPGLLMQRRPLTSSSVPRALGGATRPRAYALVGGGLDVYVVVFGTQSIWCGVGIVPHFGNSLYKAFAVSRVFPSLMCRYCAGTDRNSHTAVSWAQRAGVGEQCLS